VPAKKYRGLQEKDGLFFRRAATFTILFGFLEVVMDIMRFWHGSVFIIINNKSLH
jgi:hypothetical protein